MEKKEKKSDLEGLLNSLIDKGWKPFGEGCHRSPYKRVSVHKNYNKERTYVLFYSDNHTHWKVLRQVVSKESGLWQFCCENGMVRRTEANSGYIWELVDNYSDDEVVERYNAFWEKGSDYQYRLIESSLKDESELEDFLLSNIKVGNGQL